MSTIASPRPPPPATPSSSARASLDASRSSVVTSPVNNGNPTAAPPPATFKRQNRAALREYYNLRAPRIELPESEVPSSDLDTIEFDADAYVAKITGDSGLEELLKMYTKVVGEVRALDAEKKALVYDNYSKLIAATETIRKMRATMDPLSPMASTLDPAIAQIYSQAYSIRETLREAIPAPDSEEGLQRDAETRRRRTRELAIEVMSMPERLRMLVKDGKLDEARRQWKMPRQLLETWKEKGVGGDDVQALMDEGDAIVKSRSEDGGSAKPSPRPSPRPSDDGR